MRSFFHKFLLILILLCATLFVITLVLSFTILPNILESEINKAVRLEKGTKQFDRFMKLPFPLDFKVYVFHIENPNDVLRNNAKPNLTQKGPYVYKEHRAKSKIYADCDEDTITYTQNELFEFDAEASGELRDDEEVTVLNAALLIAYQTADDLHVTKLVGDCSDSIFPGVEQLFVTIKVKDLMFSGTEFCPVKRSENLLCALVNKEVCAISKSKKFVHTEENGSLKFSFFKYKNNTNDGVYTVKRGMDDISKLGSIVGWNYEKYTNFWEENSTCSEIKGSDSSIYPPHITKTSTFDIYSTDVCRYVTINYQKEESYKGIDGYKFVTSEQTLRAKTEYPGLDCFCTNKTKDINGKPSCFLDGVIDMQSCTGVPVLLSFPHFLWANQTYRDGVDGLAPDANIHETYLIVEPNTGTPLQGVNRIQINAVLRPIDGIRALKNLRRTVLPLLWIEEGVSLPDKYVQELNTMYFDTVKLLGGFKWGLSSALLSVIIILSGIFIYKTIYRPPNKV